jgi:hydroxymethylbilane synthase
MADKIIRIGTRETRFMASTYGREKLNDLGYKTEIVAVKAKDLILDKPLYELGITGILQKHWILP